MTKTNVLPNFLNRITNTQREEPPVMTADNNGYTDPVVEKASQGWDAINKLIDERNRMREDYEFTRQHIGALEARLEIVERDRDRYLLDAERWQRFSIEIVTNFNAIRMLIDDTQIKARNVAHSRGQPTQPPEMPLDSGEADRLKDLANQLTAPEVKVE